MCVCVCDGDECVCVCGGGGEETFGRKSILSSVRILSGVTVSRAPVLAGALLQAQHGPVRERADN